VWRWVEKALFDGGVLPFLAFLPTFLAMQKVGAQPARGEDKRNN
jgi:hypothetical protein